jgi:transcriptional regulator with XRE-family HTH domain
MMLGAQLKKARERKKLSQHEVAEQLNISQKTLSNIESDKSQPSITQLAQIGEIYEIDILELLSNQGIKLGKNISFFSLKKNDQELIEIRDLIGRILDNK